MVQVRLTRAFLAVRRCQIATGAMPRTLELLTPRYMEEVPQDPFSGRALGYTRGIDGARLFATGPDGEPDLPSVTDGDDISVAVLGASPAASERPAAQ